MHIHIYVLFTSKIKKNKKDNIHKTKFNVSDDQTNIDKYRLYYTEYYRISYHIKLILQRIIITNFCGLVSHLR